MRYLLTAFIALALCAAAYWVWIKYDGVNQMFETSASAPDIQGVEWALVTLNGEPKAQGSNASITLDAQGSIFGNGGCNRVGGTYKLTGTALEIAPNMVSTMMACVADGVAEQEHKLTQQLPGNHTVAVNGDTLTLTSDAGVLTFIKTVPAAQ